MPATWSYYGIVQTKQQLDSDETKHALPLAAAIAEEATNLKQNGLVGQFR